MIPEIFQSAFMIRAFIAGILVAIIAPIIGTFLVVRRYSLMADTLAHVSLVGVTIGLLTNTNPVMAATITSAFASLGIEKLRTTSKIFGESILALFLSGSLATASVIISLKNGLNANIFSYLFGSITTVSLQDLYFIGGLGVIVLVLVKLLFKELFFVSFDEELARASGINAGLLNRILIVLAAITVSLSMSIVGVLLIGALMVIPVITAMQFKRSFKITLFLSIIFSFLAVVSGLTLSFYLNLASGGTIVVVAILLFLMGLIINRKK